MAVSGQRVGMLRTRVSIAILLAIFLSALILMGVVFSNFPELDE